MCNASWVGTTTATCSLIAEVLATSGNNRLGGDDFDNRIIDFLVESFKQENGIWKATYEHVFEGIPMPPLEM